MKSIRIRLEGEPERLELAFKRFAEFFTIARQSRYSDSSGRQFIYLTAYLTGYDLSLYERLYAAKTELLEWQESATLLKAENEKLKQQLGLIPSPRPGDMVLGGGGK